VIALKVPAANDALFDHLVGGYEQFVGHGEPKRLIGSIKRLMIEKISGRVAYAVMSFGGFLGMGAEEHAVPWNKLTYDTNLGGYRTDITEDQLRRAPAFSRDRNFDWSDRARERELHDYYRTPYYWGV
jgi:hypothetical protein